MLNEEYATRIARDWNVKASGTGCVTRFEVEKSFMDRYDVQQAGGQTILEYWIPADELEELNRNIVGLIEVVAESTEPEPHVVDLPMYLYGWNSRRRLGS